MRAVTSGRNREIRRACQSPGLDDEDHCPHAGPAGAERSYPAGSVLAMGKNNKAHRAAKAKAKARSRNRARAGGFGGFGPAAAEPLADFAFTSAEAAAFLWTVAAKDARSDRRDQPTWRRLAAMPRQVVDRAFETLVDEQIGLMYANGWMPVELLRQGRLHGLSAGWGRLLARAIASDHAGRRAATLDSAWLAQVASLELPVENGSSGWIDRWRRGEPLQHEESLEVMLSGYARLQQLPPLHPLMPMPGPPGGRPRPVAGFVRRGATADPVLTKIRHLLAKAESSTFEAEATAFTAKAQELITRHSIDAALLNRDSPSPHTPLETRIAIDAPYADAKSFLLQTVAESGRCQAVFMPRVQMSTVVGYPGDVEAVEMLFTSLLVQAQHALNEAAKSAPAGARTRSQSYRSAFLLAYTRRIGERLRQANEQTVGEMSRESGRDLLPVLADRSSVVAGYVSDRFGDLEASAVRGGYDRAGWVGGQLAADQAQLTFGHLEDRDDDQAS